jgi:hypothetical protein
VAFDDFLDELAVGEIERLRTALANLIPWVGELAEGPAWATDEAKVRNRYMCGKALDDACALVEKKTEDQPTDRTAMRGTKARGPRSKPRF